jgi:hypothetical protein
MRQIKDILRLQWSQGLSMRSIAQSLGVGYGSVHEVLQRATAAGLQWPLPAELDDEALAQLLYRVNAGNQGRPRHKEIDRFANLAGHPRQEARSIPLVNA